MTADDIIKKLGLTPHPEGGYYRRTHMTEDGKEGRGLMTAIYYLLEGGGFAQWHMVDADELWLWHAGAPMVLEVSDTLEDTKSHTSCHTLGANILAGDQPQVLIKKGEWQRAKSLGDYTLVSCCVSPGFTFEGHIMEAETVDPN